MKTIHFDSVGGASGDMILAALIDLGVDPARLATALAALPLGPWRLEAPEVQAHHLRGRRVTVRLPEEADPHHHAPHRGLAEIRALIDAAADLPAAVRAQSLRVFTRLAEAEARVHGTTLEQIHFHEVGAVDALVDIVGGCLALHWLGVEAVSVGPLPAGHGVIRCAHGVLPNPPPATVELLQGHRVVQTDEPHELVTPTGAALLTSWATREAPAPGARLLCAGSGFGHRRLEQRPNLLRALLLEEEGPGMEGEAAATDTCLVLETNIDDTTPELLGALMQQVMAAGALDAFCTPVQMKKQRPGVLVTVLAAPADRERMLDLLFRESPTFGVREQLVRRTVLERRQVQVQTAYGPVRVKVGRWRGAEVTAAPEMEDCLRLAAERQTPVRVVYAAAQQAYAEGGRKDGFLG